MSSFMRHSPACITDSPDALTPLSPGRRRLLGAAAAGLSTTALAIRPSPAVAQTAAWPSKPIRLVVTYPTGGVSDAVARLLAPRLAERLGTQVIVENKGGAGGSIGMDAVAKSADGHTLAFAAVSPITLNAHLMKLAYDPLADLVPVACVMVSPVWLLATPLFTGRSFADVLAQSRARPGSLRLATSGVASVGHLMLEQIRDKARVDIVHVPYKGGGQIFTDAVGGQFELLTTNPGPAVNPQVAKGTLRLLAVGAPRRLETHPEAPTLAELGFAEANLTSTFGLFAPASMPPAIVQRINEEVDRLLLQPELRARLIETDNLPAPMSQADFASLVRRDYESNGKIVRSADIRAQ
jgi:tripartite-type tricarboxylate transporter receptor subunit TctC